MMTSQQKLEAIPAVLTSVVLCMSNCRCPNQIKLNETPKGTTGVSLPGYRLAAGVGLQLFRICWVATALALASGAITLSG